jgi:hypothetical protein
MTEAVIVFNMLLVTCVAAGFCLAGPLALPCGLCSTAGQLASDEPFFRAYTAQLSPEFVINRTVTFSGCRALLQCWARPLQAMWWLLLPAWCAVGSCLHILHAVAAIVVVSVLQLLHFGALYGMHAVLNLAAFCCTTGCVAVVASPVVFVPAVALIDLIAKASGGLHASAGQLRSTRTWHACFAAGREVHAQLQLVFAHCRLDCLVAYRKVQLLVYYVSMRWALSAVMSTVHMVGWCASYYMATAWCCHGRRYRLVDGCAAVCTAAQANVVGFWTRTQGTPSQRSGKQACC